MTNSRQLQALNSIELVELAHLSDEAAFSEICRRYFPRVFELARIRIGAELRTKLEPMDAVQEVFASLLPSRLKDFKVADEHSLIKYLGQILENRLRDSINKLHRKKRDIGRQTRMPSPVSDSAAGGIISTTPSRNALHREELDRLHAAMDWLKEQRPDFWDLILVVELEGKPIVDLARERNETPDAVRMRLKRAKTMLAGYMKEADVLSVDAKVTDEGRVS